jgi:N-acetylneuraminate synthase
MTKPFIIAEIGINHNGDMNITKKLIDVAVEAGCDAVKFQKRTIDSVYTQEYLNGPRNSLWGTTQREQKEGLEFGKAEYDEIDAYCKEKNISWSASAWDVDSQIFLQQYDLPFNKIASAMLTYTPLLEVVASEKKHTFISTGMSTYEDIERTVNIFENNECPYTLMHCVSTYPCKDEDCNLNGLHALQKKFHCTVGYSGHEKGILPTLLAVVTGANVIERHITLDKEMYGSDQSASLEPQELNELMTNISSLAGIFGNGEKVISESEAAVAEKLRYWL